MSSHPDRQPPQGSIGYLQVPTTDLRASIAFYDGVFGWRGEEEFGSFEAPGVIGQWTTELAPAQDGGPAYERLLADGELVLQLHHEGTDHHHGPVGDPELARGNGVLVWFGDVTDFDGVVERAARLGGRGREGTPRNPPEGQGNGPGHREIWIRDPDGYVVAVASPDGEVWTP